MIRELLLSVKKMNSAALLALLRALHESPGTLGAALAPLHAELEALASAAPGKLTSEFDVVCTTLRSTGP